MLSYTENHSVHDDDNSHLAIPSHHTNRSLNHPNPSRKGISRTGHQKVGFVSTVPDETEGERSHGRVREKSGPDSSVRSTVRRTLEEWRSDNSVERVREMLSDNTPSYTVIEQATGGCLDSMAAALVGFAHLGGTEDITKPLGRAKSEFFEDMTGAQCLGDARDWRKWSSRFKTGQIDYYKAGMPCTDYASLGYQEGCLGNKGGNLFLHQADTILHLLPKVCRLEMVPTQP